jgi:hypothetical protein
VLDWYVRGAVDGGFESGSYDLLREDAYREFADRMT